jgi:3-oxoacyl-[acyl-carrier protein] reductase
MQEHGELNGKIALVTGGSRGIGRGVALKLAQAGCDVIINYVEREDAAHEVVSWIRGMGRRSLAIKADVSKEQQVALLFREISEQFGKLNILVNNVGPFLLRPLGMMTSDEWRTMLDGNLSSAWYVSKASTELMAQSGWGRRASHRLIPLQKPES